MGASAVMLLIGGWCGDGIGSILQFAALKGATFVTTPDGKEWFVVYHTHKELEGGHKRELNIDRLTITDGPDGASFRHRLWPHRHGTDGMFVAAFERAG